MLASNALEAFLSESTPFWGYACSPAREREVWESHLEAHLLGRVCDQAVLGTCCQVLPCHGHCAHAAAHVSQRHEPLQQNTCRRIVRAW